MIQNQAGQSIGAQMISASSGAAYVGTVTVYITIDAGTQAIGSVGSGICTAEGNGYYTYQPTTAETNGRLLAFTFIGTGAIPATIQVATLQSTQQVAIAGLAGATTRVLRDVLTQALKRINVLQANETPDASMLNDAFERCNDWVDSIWGNDRLAIYTKGRTTWTLTAGKGLVGNPYTIGPGGDVAMTRPQFIDHINFIDNSLTPAVERPLVLLTWDGWSYLPIKSSTGLYPMYAYYEPTYTSAQGSLYLWQSPTSANLQGVLYAPTQITSFASLDDSVALPPGYNRFLRDNLAIELAAEFRDGIPLDPTLQKSAAESKAQVKRTNIRLYDMSVDAALLVHGGTKSNIYVG